jgi:RNA polymerase sigma factor (sigma-70 family)
VYVVDDDPRVLKALKRLLTEAGFDVTTFSQGRQFLDRPPHPGPACLILDMCMPELTGLELQRRVAAIDRSLSIVFISGHDDVPASVHAMKAGAIDFLVKPIEGTHLIGAVTQALASSAEALRAHAERDKFLTCIRRLSLRERQVGARVIQGTPNRQIGWELGITERTVKVHRARLMQKLQVQSVAELVRLLERLHASLEAAPDFEEAFAAGSPTSTT